VPEDREIVTRTGCRDEEQGSVTHAFTLIAPYQHGSLTRVSDPESCISGYDGDFRPAPQSDGALRSLFAWAKTNGVVFANPTSGIRIGRRDHSVFQPPADRGDCPDGRRRCHSAGPARRRLGGCARRQTWSDPRPATGRCRPINRRLTNAGRAWPLGRPHTPRPARLASPPPSVLAEHRNPHLLISARTALGHGPVSAAWANKILRGQPAHPGATAHRQPVRRSRYPPGPPAAPGCGLQPRRVDRDPLRGLRPPAPGTRSRSRPRNFTANPRISRQCSAPCTLGFPLNILSFS
jgi:hypothetical protein